MADDLRIMPWGQGTVRVLGGGASVTRLVLVVGMDVASHFWLNILPLCADARVRHYVVEADLRSVASRLHTIPLVTPCFLVLSGDGYFVDWFPAPLPSAGAPPEPHTLLNRAVATLGRYEIGSREKNSAVPRT